MISRINQDFPQALSFIKESLQISREIDKKVTMVVALNELSVIQRKMQNYREARLATEESEVICKEIGESYENYAYNNLAVINIKEGNLAGARRIGKQSLVSLQKGGDKLGIIECLHTFALLAATQDQWEEYVWLYAAAETLRQQMSISRDYMSEQAELDRLNEQPTHHLDAATLDRLRVKGQTDSLDDIVNQLLDKGSVSPV